MKKKKVVNKKKQINEENMKKYLDLKLEENKNNILELTPDILHKLRCEDITLGDLYCFESVEKCYRDKSTIIVILSAKVLKERIITKVFNKILNKITSAFNF